MNIYRNSTIVNDPTGTENVILSFSGFDVSQVTGLKRLFRALDLVVAPTFTRRSTHLLCPCGEGPKFEKALEWDIPVVGMDWIWSLKEGVVQRVSTPTAAHDSMGIEDPKTTHKGKGKAVDRSERGSLVGLDAGLDAKIHDIVNSASSYTSSCRYADRLGLFP